MKQTTSSHSQIVLDKDKAESADDSQIKQTATRILDWLNYDTELPELRVEIEGVSAIVGSALTSVRKRERERCAKIAETVGGTRSASFRCYCEQVIAAAIRNPTTQANGGSQTQHVPDQGSVQHSPSSVSGLARQAAEKIYQDFVSVTPDTGWTGHSVKERIAAIITDALASTRDEQKPEERR